MQLVPDDRLVIFISDLADVAPCSAQLREVKLSIFLYSVIDATEPSFEVIWLEQSPRLALNHTKNGHGEQTGNECQEEDRAAEIGTSSLHDHSSFDT